METFDTTDPGFEESTPIETAPRTLRLVPVDFDNPEVFNTDANGVVENY